MPRLSFRPVALLSLAALAGACNDDTNAFLGVASSETALVSFVV